MDKLIALTIGNTPITAPAGIPIGGLDKAYDIGSNFILLGYTIAVLLALIFLIWGGIKWVTSQGDKTKVQAARNTLVYAVIGLVIIFLSYFIINFITYLFNLPSVTTAPTSNSGTNPNSEQVGCFDNKDDPSLPPGCYGYSPNNDPKNPRNWYPDMQSCIAACQ